MLSLDTPMLMDEVKITYNRDNHTFSLEASGGGVIKHVLLHQVRQLSANRDGSLSFTTESPDA